MVLLKIEGWEENPKKTAASKAGEIGARRRRRPQISMAPRLGMGRSNRGMGGERASANERVPKNG